VKNSTVGTYVIIAAAAAVLVVVFFFRSAAVEAVYPMERTVRYLKTAVWPCVRGVFTGPAQAAENARLRREVAVLSMMTGEVERLERENASLRRSLGYSERHGEQWIVGPVIADHAGGVGSGHVIRVGRGSADGVVEGAIVMRPEGLVGQVYGVTAHTCEVGLVTDPELKVSCSVLLEPNRQASGILAGGDRRRLALTHISGMSLDSPQARVVTSGRGGVFPRGLDVGVLVRASGGTGEWSGEVRPAVAFDELEDVFISRER